MYIGRIEHVAEEENERAVIAPAVFACSANWLETSLRRSLNLPRVARFFSRFSRFTPYFTFHSSLNIFLSSSANWLKLPPMIPRVPSTSLLRSCSKSLVVARFLS